MAPRWDNIWRTPSWDVVHCDATSVEGWLVLATREHRSAIADVDDAAMLELGTLLKRASRALHDLLGCEKTYVVQFAEHPLHPHVHFHVIPRHPNHSDAHKGPAVFDLLGLPDDECVPEARRNEISEGVAPYFSDDTSA